MLLNCCKPFTFQTNRQLLRLSKVIVTVPRMSYSNGQGPTLKNPNLFIQKAYINGEWLDAKSGKTFNVYDPSNLKLIGTAPEMGLEELDEAINGAAEAMKSFSKLTGRQRGRILRKWYDLIIDNKEDLAKILTWENGKTLSESSGEILYASSFFEWFSEEAPRVYGDTIPSQNPNHRIITVKQPVGVCGVITPWNFPAGMISRKVGAALAAGCTSVVKPAAETPYSALALAYLGEQAGVPKGVFNVVTTHLNTKEVGQELCENHLVRKVSFTGSTPVGKLLMRQSASSLKKLSFELGGNAPFIVFADADLEAAVEGALVSKFRGTGQTCICSNRFYVHSSIYDEFCEKFTAKVKELKIGNGFDPSTTQGPLINGNAVNKVEKHVNDAISKNGTVLIGGKRSDVGENFFEPTLISNVTPDMILVKEETFGPLAPIIKFDTEEEVVKLANLADVGLAGYFYSKDISRVFRVAEAIEVGMLGVNTGLMTEAALPFGGIKQSGFGREGSKYGIDDYLVVKTVVVGNVPPL